METTSSAAAVRFTAGGAEIGGELFLPSHPPAPALVLIPDVRGIAPLYRRLGARLAGEGFTTLVLDIYSREGAPELPDMDAVLRCIEGLPDGRVLADIAAATRYLAGREDIRPGRIGVLGFCLGGQYALMAACRVEGLAACVSFYGMLRYARRLPHKPASPLDMATQLGCPLLGLYGEEDALIPNEDVAELRRILGSAGKTYEIVTFPGAGHAFLNEDRPEAYRPAAASDAWRRAIGFLHHVLDP